MVFTSVMINYFNKPISYSIVLLELILQPLDSLCGKGETIYLRFFPEVVKSVLANVSLVLI